MKKLRKEEINKYGEIFFSIFITYLFHAGISVKIKGEANTCWTTDKQEMDERGQYRDETQTVTAHEEYFETKYYLIGSASGKIRLSIICNRILLSLIKVKIKQILYSKT